MSINNNAWELAEAYVSGALSKDEHGALKLRMASDVAFAAEFNENVRLIKSLQESGKQKRFRNMLKDIEHAETGIEKAKRLFLSAHIWRTAAVAASVAILFSTITIWNLKPSIQKTDSQYNIIRGEVDVIKRSQYQLKQSQKQLEKDIKKINTPPPSPVRYVGTGFALNNDGYFVTSAHVTENADSVYIQIQSGDYYKATKIAVNTDADIAVLKVEKKNFHFGKGEVPYTFAAKKTGIGAHIYTLGFQTDDIMYSEGYISSKNGYAGNDLQYTLELPAGHGQSGSPVIDEKGNIVGILAAIGSQEQANTYAVSAQSLLALLETKSPDMPAIHLPKVNKLGKMSRDQQIEKMQTYTFSVKVYKK